MKVCPVGAPALGGPSLRLPGSSWATLDEVLHTPGFVGFGAREGVQQLPFLREPVQTRWTTQVLSVGPALISCHHRAHAVPVVVWGDQSQGCGCIVHSLVEEMHAVWPSPAGSPRGEMRTPSTALGTQLSIQGELQRDAHGGQEQQVFLALLLASRQSKETGSPRKRPRPS